MATSSSNYKPIEEECAVLTIDEEEDSGLVLEEEDGMHNEESYILVGKLLIEKPVKVNYMKETLVAAWGPGKGMTVKRLLKTYTFFSFFMRLTCREF